MNKTDINKRIRFNNKLIKVLIVLAVCTVVAFGVNIVRVVFLNAGQGTTLANTKVNSEYKNDYYSIGNNPTDINKTYFKELNTAVKNKSDSDIAQSVVKCFITEYYTWDNKDGNYDIGGMEYIYTPQLTNFSQYTLNNFYVDLDLYITKYGTENLMQVKDVTVASCVDGGSYAVVQPGDQTKIQEGEDSPSSTSQLASYTVTASWTYEDNSTIDTAQFQNHAVFHVVNNDGRWEIAGIDAQ